jgi:hypothetical protein
MREGAISVVLYLLSLAVAGASGAVGGALYVRHQPRPPRVVVLDIRRLAEPVVNDASLSDAARRQRITQIGSALSQNLAHYAQDGAIVLDGSAVLRAPREAYVEP